MLFTNLKFQLKKLWIFLRAGGGDLFCDVVGVEELFG